MLCCCETWQVHASPGSPTLDGEALVEMHFTQGEMVVQQDEPGNTFYIMYEARNKYAMGINGHGHQWPSMAINGHAMC